MNTFLLFISLLITICNSQTIPPITTPPINPTLPPLSDLEYQQKFTDFLLTYNKSYTNNEFTQRFLIFKDTLNYILNFNALTGNDTDALKLDINIFADITVEEYKNIYLNKIIGTNQTTTTTTISSSSTSSSSTTGSGSGGLLTGLLGGTTGGLLGNLLGTTVNVLTGIGSKEENKDINILQSRKLNEVNTLNVDWRNLAPHVKNQGQCGSCYSFSAIGALEAAIKRRSGSSVLLSEQELVDCSQPYGSYGCDGGFMTSSFKYIKEKGVNQAQNYPYRGNVGQCRPPNSNKATLNNHVVIAYGNEAALEQALASVGPISIALDASPRSFMMYKSGIYDEPACTQSLTHAVLLVGMGNENGKSFYTVKNSWGTGWGEAGYFRIARGKNRCGIANMASYPVL